MDLLTDEIEGSAERTRGDLCPGAFRPWPAADGALVRLRLIGGALPATVLRALGAFAAMYGDGNIHLTARANLQVRGLPLTDGALPDEVVAAITATGLLPHATHELVRNVMVSPLSGVSGGVADLRALARRFDELLCADPALAELPGRFLTVLDDGRGDVQGRSLDLGAMAVDPENVQLRAGSDGWGDVVALSALPELLIALAHQFLAVRGDGDGAAWHVDELDSPLLAGTRDVRTLRNSGPLPYGLFEGGEHREVPGGLVTPDLVTELVGDDDEGAFGDLIVTPWNGIVILGRQRLG